MKKLYAITLLLASQYAVTHAQVTLPAGARSLGLSNTSATLTDVYAMHNNIAGIAPLKSVSAGLYVENRYLVKELTNYGIMAAIPTKKGNFGLNIGSQGGKGLNTTRIGVGYARAFSKWFNVGMSLNYINTKFSDAYYGSANKFTVAVGMQAKVVDNLYIGAHLYNPTLTLISKNEVYKEYVPTTINIGMRYDFSKVLSALVQVDKNTISKPKINLGVEYRIVEQFYLRGGFSSNDIRSSFGFGYKSKQLTIDFAAGYHYKIGFVPQFSLAFNLPESVSKTQHN
ncbi:MAG: hypothetical protein H7331_07205 [Bacteroidia bacterium]|nr:hypothetical protein [Bacteroidia bacterium]